MKSADLIDTFDWQDENPAIRSVWCLNFPVVETSGTQTVPLKQKPLNSNRQTVASYQLQISAT